MLQVIPRLPNTIGSLLYCLTKVSMPVECLRFHCCSSFLKRKHLRKILYDLSERHDHQRDRYERRQRHRDQQSQVPQSEREVFHPINVRYYSVNVGGRREVLRIRRLLINSPLAIEAIVFELTPDLASQRPVYEIAAPLRLSQLTDEQSQRPYEQDQDENHQPDNDVLERGQRLPIERNAVRNLSSQNARSESPTNINPPAWSGWPGISRRSRRVISHRKRAQRNARHSQPKNRRMNSGTLTNAFHHPAKDKVR